MIVRVVTAKVRSERAVAFNDEAVLLFEEWRDTEDLLDNVSVEHYGALDVDLDESGAVAEGS